jgi:flavorubredoxin
MSPDSSNVAARETLNVAFSEFNAKKHKIAIAESFGGNDEPVDKLTSDLVSLGLDPVFTLRVRQTPTEQVWLQGTPCRCHSL